MAADPSRTIDNTQVRPGTSPTPSVDPRVLDNLRDAGRQFKEVELVPEMATIAEVDDAVAAGGGGGGGAWSIVAKGIVATGAAEASVFTATAGRSYCLIALNAAQAGGLNWSPGDEDQITLVAANLGGSLGANPLIDVGSLTVTTPFQATQFIEVIAFVVGLATKAQAQSGGGGGTDATIFKMHLDDGDITVEHSNGGANTNGIYVLYERQ